ncbi:MAG TPA: hypothetical protein VJU61_07615 [Polyangiaceae bacterium]|nr:hypothetical protein [Polyangiaceae bacterium]
MNEVGGQRRGIHFGKCSSIRRAAVGAIYRRARAPLGLYVLALLASGCGTDKTALRSDAFGQGATARALSEQRDAGGDAAAGAACPPFTLPSYDQLPENPKFPDPFTTLAGNRLTKKAQWACRQAEISAALQEYELGPKPPRPAQVSGQLGPTAFTVTAGDGTTSISFDATITLPTTGTAPYPALIGIGNSSLDNALLASLGVALIRFPNGAVAAQVNGQSRGQGSFYTLHGSDHGAGAMMAWAWGVSRLIDALETTPGTQIDPTRLGVTGCSRNGKGALVVGAFDERIKLTIPQESGSGGSASWRVSDFQQQQWIAAGSPADPVSEDVQTLHQIVQENVWFRASFSQFSYSANRLPFDHHLLMGLVAPRALLVIENTSQFWLGKRSTFTNSAIAHRIYEALGIPDSMAYSQIGDHAHCQFPASQIPLLTAYVQKFLIGGGTDNTNVIETDGGFVVDEARWVDWTTPALE